MRGAFPGGDLIENTTFVVGNDRLFAAWEGPSHDPEITPLKLATEVVRQLVSGQAAPCSIPPATSFASSPPATSST